MSFLDWWLGGCATLAGGAAGYCWSHAHWAYDALGRANDDFNRLAGDFDMLSSAITTATTDAVDWRHAHTELDNRITRAHTVATALGQTDIVTILEGETA